MAGADIGVAAVVVTYAPDAARLAQVIDAVVPQVDRVIVVDNGNGVGLGGISWSAVLQRIDMGGNAGVAAAQNAGMLSGYSQGASHVLLLDHDSVPQAGMVKILYEASTRCTQGGRRVAAVGANYRDPRRPAISPFVRVSRFRLHRLDHLVPTAIWPVSYLISSGSLISAEAFKAVGIMKERLFIDYVDIEWGLRAGQLGWVSLGVCDAELDHVLGDEPLRIFGTDYPARSPTRHYYMVRNAVWLITRTSLPRAWKTVEAWRLLRRTIAYAVFASRPQQHIQLMFQGLIDGLRGRLGERNSMIGRGSHRTASN